MDASVFNYSSWGQDQPNEHEDYFCVAIVFENGSWYDRSCTDTRRQLCQRSANIEPSFFSRYPQTYVHGLTENQQELVNRIKTVEEQFLKLSEKSNFTPNISDLSLPRSNLQPNFDFWQQIVNDSKSDGKTLSDRLSEVENEITVINSTFHQRKMTNNYMIYIACILSFLSFLLSLVVCFCARYYRRPIQYRNGDRHNYHRESFKNVNIYDDIQLK
ncbi:hypothetical protein B4U80_14546 [Leptotrombidium deliense]|uniref:C-type lectin domain-containing protein n=1 Tax=Leptotrombidium deliense TaxID=299467 RepID=A0A443RUV6_9ACAR|nr:hypothetical protein B4U80_14546 [Leptotrombidium deliense]